MTKTLERIANHKRCIERLEAYEEAHPHHNGYVFAEALKLDIEADDALDLLMATRPESFDDVKALAKYLSAYYASWHGEQTSLPECFGRMLTYLNAVAHSAVA